jgi:DNA-binding winged helix-turn-helix (wHTH) protein
LAVAINRIREELMKIKYPFEIATKHGYGYKLIYKLHEKENNKKKKERTV